MKRIFFILMALFLLSACGGNVLDRNVELYEDATRKIESVEGVKEFHSMERQLNNDILKWKSDNAKELTEFRKLAKDGDKKLVEQLREVEMAKRAYRKAKMLKRRELKGKAQ